MTCGCCTMRAASRCPTARRGWGRSPRRCGARPALRDAAAEEPLGQDATPLDPGHRGGPRRGRSHHHRRSQRTGTDQTGAARMKTRPMLTLDDCRRISAAAEAEAKRNNWNVCIAILDDGGHLLHLARMDGASPANARIAVEKGRTAAESRRSTLVWEERLKAGRNSMLGMPGITPVQGGLPIMAEGVCLGGVGVSGVQSTEDEQIAAAGIKALA